jgi:signal peptidase I
MTTPTPEPPAIRRFFRDLGLAFLACLFTLIFLFQPFRVEGTSMLPAIRDQERILVNKLVYDVAQISRGDVIVFRYPLDPRKSFIKRVIGVPGDVVEVNRGQVRINGETIAEIDRHPGRGIGRGLPRPVRVPDGQYFVLGDHRSVSNDSREWGLVAEELIHGKAVFRYWPPAQFGLVD